eukprot:1148781-Pelagomonas_calceolata.AAC.5
MGRSTERTEVGTSTHSVFQCIVALALLGRIWQDPGKQFMTPGTRMTVANICKQEHFLCCMWQEPGVRCMGSQRCRAWCNALLDAILSASQDELCKIFRHRDLFRGWCSTDSAAENEKMIPRSTVTQSGGRWD